MTKGKIKPPANIPQNEPNSEFVLLRPVVQKSAQNSKLSGRGKYLQPLFDVLKLFFGGNLDFHKIKIKKKVCCDV